MKILTRKGENWQEMPALNYDNEAEMQQLIANDPNILPLKEIGYDQPFVTIGKEISLGSGFLDALAVDAAGHIVLIETKLRSNPEIRRTVVGQVLEYASHLWKASYDELDTIHFRKCLPQLKRHFDGPLAAYVAEQTGDEGFDETEFKEGIEKRLQLGSFTLLIVTDETTNDLRDIADYLNDRTGQGIDFYVVEVEMRGEKPNELLIPRLANPARKTNETNIGGQVRAGDPYDRTPQGEDEFFATLNGASRAVAEQLLATFADSDLVKTVWRKTGFSLITPMNKELTGDYKGSFSHIFFTNGLRTGGKGDIRFDFTKWYADKFPLIAERVKPYLDYIAELKPNEKMIVEEPTVLVGRVDELKQQINEAAKAISKNK